MARAKNPGRKGTPKKGVWVGIDCTCQGDETMPLSEALELAVKRYKEQCEAQGIVVYGTGLNAYIGQLLRQSPDISEFLESTKTDLQTP